MEFPEESFTRITIQADLEDEPKAKYYSNKHSEDKSSPNTRLPKLLQRRLANSEAMMRELHRYQNIMFLTLLPSISGQPSTSTPTQQTVNGESMPNPPHSQSVPLPSASRLRRNSMFEQKSNFPLVKREQSLEEKSKTIDNSGSKLMHVPKEVACISNIFTPVPSTSSVSDIHISDHEKRRNKSGKVRDLLRSSLNFPSLDENELDFTTLTALYLENRKKLFGEEWSKRRDGKGSHRSIDVGASGMVKPRKLMPLEGKSSEPGTSRLPDLRPESSLSYHPRPIVDCEMPIQMPTPGGLHLSAHFTLNSFSSETDASIRPRKGSRKSALRRLNSLDEVSLSNVEGESRIHRTNSAPDISKRGKSNLNDEDSIVPASPPLVTPARANTPTEPGKSVHMIRPQLIGGSLATCSPEQSFTISKSNSSIETKKKKDEERKKSIVVDKIPPLKLRPQSMGRPYRSSIPATAIPSIIAEEESSAALFPVKPEIRRSKGSKLRLLPLDKPLKKHSVP